MKKRILFLNSYTHSGHTVASRNISSAIKKIYGHKYEIHDLNIGKIFPNISQILAKIYPILITKFPDLWKSFYSSTEEIYSEYSSILKKLLQFAHSKKLITKILETKPDVIITTHAFSSNIITYMKIKGYLNSQHHIAVCTDFYVNKYWPLEYIDTFVLHTEEQVNLYPFLKPYIKKIKFFGIPISSEFSIKLEKNQVKKYLGIEHKKTVITIAGGNYGIMYYKTLCKKFYHWDEISLILLLGKNTQLQKTLIKKYQNKFLILGYTDKIPLIYSATDILITKPGGLTLAEAISKHLPVISCFSLPGPEQYNLEFITKNSLGIKTKNISSTVDLVEHVIYNNYRFWDEKSFEKYKKLYSSEHIARYVQQVI